jgi:hypothetical protein
MPAKKERGKGTTKESAVITGERTDEKENGNEGRKKE